MAKKTGRKKATKKACAKGPRGKACRKRRRGAAGLGDGHLPGATKAEKAARMARLQAMWSAQNRGEVSRAGLIHAPAQAAITAPRVAASEAKALVAGCTAPRGKTCVDKAVGHIKGKGTRAGCVKFKGKGVKNTYVCTNRAVTQQSKGRGYAVGYGVDAGYRFVSMRKAVDAKGKFKAGCRYQVKAGKAQCKKA